VKHGSPVYSPRLPKTKNGVDINAFNIKVRKSTTRKGAKETNRLRLGVVRLIRIIEKVNYPKRSSIFPYHPVKIIRCPLAMWTLEEGSILKKPVTATPHSVPCPVIPV